MCVCMIVSISGPQPAVVSQTLQKLFRVKTPGEPENTDDNLADLTPEQAQIKQGKKQLDVNAQMIKRKSKITNIVLLITANCSMSKL